MEAPDTICKEEECLSSESESEPEPEGDLRDELNDALKATESGFSGSFYHCTTDHNAPNPGLFIDGLGLVGLPLNHREAQLIISQSAQAPFGKGAETVVDTQVRDTWEIDAKSVSFKNPRWQTYVDQLASKTVWSTLGVAPYASKPRCDLYKLLLYQPGSHFLPHQDTAKAPGMFATIVIVLPSAFQGGEVHVSHAGTTKVLDVSQASGFDTSILAWYTDVMHEVKPITAGYRLALSYNLIHTSPNVPPPALPEQMNMLPLRECLEKWNADGFETTPETPLVAYLLHHQYSADNLDNGRECLKGKDANMIAQLLPVAESLGIVVCLGNLERTVTGIAEDEGYGYHRRGRWGYSDSEEETPCMGEIEEDSYEITNMVRIDEADEDEVDFGSFAIDQECLIPEEPFDGAAPDKEDYEGYMGNGAGSMSQWYNSSVLILIRREDVMPTGISLRGYDWALQQLHLSANPDPKSEQIVSSVLARLEGPKHAVYNPTSAKDEQSARTILQHAVAWRRPELWNKVIRHCGPALETANTAISDALDVFEFESIKPGLTQLVNQSTALQVRFDIITVIAAKIGRSVHSEWVEALAKEALSSYRAAAVADVPKLVEISKERGVSIIEASILPHVAKTGTYDFLMALAKALEAYRVTLEDSPSPWDQTRASITKVVRQCVVAAIPQWEVRSTAPGYGAAVVYAKANRLSELLDFCFLIEDFELCTTLANVAAKTGTYESRIAFAKTMHEHLKKLPQTEDYVEKREQFGTAVHTCVSAAIASLQQQGNARYNASSTPAEVACVRELLPFCFDIGHPNLCVTFLNAVQQHAPYELLVDFAKTLHSQITRIKNTTGDDALKLVDKLRKVVRRSIEVAATKWEVGLNIPVPYHGYYGLPIPQIPSSKAPNVKTNRICELVDLCFSLNDLVPCVTLFNALLNVSQSPTYETRFAQIYEPLIPQLKATLAKHGKSIGSEPFASFFRLIISVYLSRILAPSTPASIPTSLPARTAGCKTCSRCRDLQAFLNNSNKDIQFSAIQSVRTHLGHEILKAGISDIVTTDTIRRGSPHTLVVTKRPQILAQLRWKKCQADAAAFVRSVAEDGELRRIMPDRYNEVVRAVQGTSTFPAPANLTIHASVVTVETPATGSADNGANTGEPDLPLEPSLPGPGPSTSAVPTVASSSTTVTVAGTKRKHREPPKNTIAVIDLT